MRTWRITLFCVVFHVFRCERSRLSNNTKVSEEWETFIRDYETGDIPNSNTLLVSSEVLTLDEERFEAGGESQNTRGNQTEDPTRNHIPFQHADVPQGLSVYPLPMPGSDHELMFNVSWVRPNGPLPKDYSVEVRSITDTDVCKATLCYEYNIPGDKSWWITPAMITPVVGTCAVRPGCTYQVRLKAHPWDGHSYAKINVALDECVAGVCSCAHAPRLPSPAVSATLISIHGELFVNVSWSLPPPSNPQRLPKGLNKQSYVVSLAKQMVSDAYPAPWYANTISRKVDADGPVFVGDSNSRSILLPVNDKNYYKRKIEQGKGRNDVKLDVKLLARINLIDDRGCVGPAGNATAYDPTVPPVFTSGNILWALFGGFSVLVVVIVLIFSAHFVKRMLNAFPPATAAVATPLKPLRTRPTWFPFPLHR